MGEMGGGVGTSAAVKRVKRSQQQSEELLGDKDEDDEDDAPITRLPNALRLLLVLWLLLLPAV